MKVSLKTVSTLFLCAGIISCTGELDNGEQDGNHAIDFPENPVIVGYSSDTYQAAVISSDEWIAEPADDWIYDVVKTGEGIEFTVEANDADTFRDGGILFSVPGSSYTRTLTVRQSGNTGKLSVEKTEISIATTGGTQTVSVSSAENWTVSTATESTWLTAEKVNSSTLSVSAGPNYSGSPLEAELTLSTVSGAESIDKPYPERVYPCTPGKLVHDAHALDVVEEPAARALMVGVGEKALAGMSEGRVTEVVPKGDGLDEVQVEAQGSTDVARHASHELHVQPTAAEVVVRAKREDLRLARQAVVGRQVHDLLGIAHEGGAQRGISVALARVAANGRGVATGKRREAPRGQALGNQGRGTLGEPPGKAGGEPVLGNRHASP